MDAQIPLQGVIAGRYKIEGVIGGGSFGTVLRVRDLLANTPALRAARVANGSDEDEDEDDDECFALKIIRNQSILSESIRTRREIEVVCFLKGDRNPHVVSVRRVFTLVAPYVDNVSSSGSKMARAESGPDDTDKSFAIYRDSNILFEKFAQDAENSPKSENNVVGILMPLLNGDLQTRPTILWRDGPFGEVGRTTAAIIGFQLLYGLDFAHRCGLVHRDIKPANVLLDVDDSDPYDTVLQLADFGLAREASLFNGSPYICTRNYRPPEVIVNGAASTAADPKVDVWSVGCVLFEMLTGKCLFRLDSSLQAGSWDGQKAATQLEVILDMVGTPTAAAVNKYLTPENPVKSYLLATTPRPGHLKELILGDSTRLKDTCMEEREMWYQLISSCVKFFPDERPTVDQLCRHPLFQTYKIDYSTMGNANNENFEDFSEWRKAMYEKVRCEDEMGYEANNCARLFRFIRLHKTWL